MKINFKIILLILLLIVGISSVIVGIVYHPLIFFLEQLCYWLIFLILLDLILLFRLESKKILFCAFLITGLGAFLNILSFLGTERIAETILRIGFIFWIVGVGYLMIPTKWGNSIKKAS